MPQGSGNCASPTRSFKKGSGESADAGYREADLAIGLTRTSRTEGGRLDQNEGSTKALGRSLNELAPGGIERLHCAIHRGHCI